MPGDVRGAQGFGVVDEVPEEPAPVGKGDTRQVRYFLLAQSDGDELLQLLAVVAQHSERSVPGIDQAHRGSDDAAQDDGQFQFAAHRHDGLQKVLEAALGAGKVAQAPDDLVQLGIHSMAQVGDARLG